MTTAATIAAKLTLDNGEFDAGITGSSKKVSNFSSDFEKKIKAVGSQMSSLGSTLLKGAFVFGAAGAAALGTELYKDVQAAMDAEKIQAQLNAVLKSTGGVAGVTAQQVNSLADALSTVTPFEDEAIIAGENMLLTFTNIGKDIFPQATETILDMATALGQDLQGSAMQLGKALNDPVAGVTALRRVGVKLTDAQEKVIKALVETGDVAGAQKLILQELQTEFGGSAKAAGKTFAGQLEILKNKLGNVRENIGAKLLPVLGNLAEGLSTWLNQPKTQKFLDGLAVTIGNLANTAGYFIDAFANGGLAAIFKMDNLGDSPLNTLLQTFGMTEEAANNFSRYFQLATTKIGLAWNALVTAFKNDKGLIVAVLAVLGSALLAFAYTSIAAIFPIVLIIAAIGLAAYLLYTAWTQNWGGIQEKTAALWAWLQPILSSVKTWLEINIPIAIAKLMDWWNELVPVINDVWDWITSVIENGMDFIYKLTNGQLGALSEAWDRTMNFIKFAIDLWLKQIRLIFTAFKALFEGDWRKLGETLRQLWDNAWKGMAQLVQTSWANIRSFLSSAVSSLQSWWAGIDWANMGRNLIESIGRGMAGALPTLLRAAGNILNALRNFFAGFFGGGGSGKIPNSPGSPDDRGGFARGTNGWMTVPAGYPNDSYSIRVQSGEQFAVIPKGGSMPSGGGGTVNYFHPLITIKTGETDPKKAMKGFT